MKPLNLSVFIYLSMALLAGCAGGRPIPPTIGLFYSHTVKPLDINQDRTPVAEKTGKGNIKHIYFAVNAAWDSNAIGDIARENGIETIYYADFEKLTVLEVLQIIFIGPVYRQYTVHVYGK